MKTENKLIEAFDEAEAKELDALLGGIDTETNEFTAHRIKRAVLKKTGLGTEERSSDRFGKTKKARGSLLPRSKRLLAAAAALVFLIGAALGGTAYAVESKEYNAAISFFAENDLSTEGLTRSEIKAVYRDITTESFTYSKTAEVLEHSGKTITINGMSFPAVTEAPMDLQAGLDLSYERYLSTVRYEFSSKREAVNGGYKFKDCTIKKMIGSETVWSVTTDKLDVHNAFAVGDGVVVSGWLPYEYSVEEDEIQSTAAVMKLDPEGGFVWISPLQHGNISSVIENVDGSIAVFCSDNDHTDLTGNKLFVTRLDARGNILSSVETPSEQQIWVCDVVPFEDGYIGVNYVQDYTGTNEQHVVKFDAEGRLSEEFTYGEEGLEYRLFDIAVFGGKLYISATACSDPYEAYYGEGEWWKQTVPDEEFTEAVKQACTAVLLVCDTVGGEPHAFYQAEGSGGMRLTVTEEGRLEWEVLSVYTASFTPVLNSRPYQAMAKVFKYYFADDGSFAEKTDTGEVTIFRR